MPLQPPPSPSINPRQMTLLRIVASMAWADGHLASEEVDIMLDRFSRLFSNDPAQQQKLQQELRDYVVQNIPLDQLIPRLESVEERELVLQLGYEVIQSSSRTPDEPAINAEEEAAYQHLVKLLNLPADVVERLESEAKVEAANSTDIVSTLVDKVEKFIHP